MIRESANIVVCYLKKLQTKKYNLFIIFINQVFEDELGRKYILDSNGNKIYLMLDSDGNPYYLDENGNKIYIKSDSLKNLLKLSKYVKGEIVIF